MQHHPRSIQPEPDHQAALAPEPIADLVNTSAQSLACEAQYQEKCHNSSNDKPGQVLVHLCCLSRIHLFLTSGYSCSSNSSRVLVQITWPFLQTYRFLDPDLCAYSHKTCPKIQN